MGDKTIQVHIFSCPSNKEHRIETLTTVYSSRYAQGCPKPFVPHSTYYIQTEIHLGFLLTGTNPFLRPLAEPAEELRKEALCKELLHCYSAEALKESLAEVPSSTFCIPPIVHSGCLYNLSWMSKCFT